MGLPRGGPITIPQRVSARYSPKRTIPARACQPARSPVACLDSALGGGQNNKGDSGTGKVDSGRRVRARAYVHRISVVRTGVSVWGGVGVGGVQYQERAKDEYYNESVNRQLSIGC